MKITIIVPSEAEIPRPSYREYVQKISDESLSRNHDVECLCLGSGDFRSETAGDLPNSRILESEALSEGRYWVENQALSDELLRSLAIEGDQLIVAPLAGGYAFSLLRARRLLSDFSEVKIAVYVDDCIALSKGGGAQSLQDELVSEMEHYSLRHADLIISGEQEKLDRLKYRLGSGQVEVFDPQDESDASFNFLEKLQSGKKPSAGGAVAHDLTVLVTWDGSDLTSSQIDRLREFEADGMEVLYFPTLEEALPDFASFEPQVGAKVATQDTLQDLRSVLGQIRGKFVTFFEGHVDPSIKFISTAIDALGRNYDLSYIGSYLKDSSRYPFGFVNGLSSLVPTIATGGYVFKQNSLATVLEQGVKYNGQWELLVRLNERYQGGDIVPSAVNSLLGEGGVNDQERRDLLLDELPRAWSSYAARFVRIVLNDPEVLDWKSTQSHQNEWEHVVGDYSYQSAEVVETEVEPVMSEETSAPAVELPEPIKIEELQPPENKSIEVPKPTPAVFDSIGQVSPVSLGGMEGIGDGGEVPKPTPFEPETKEVETPIKLSTEKIEEPDPEIPEEEFQEPDESESSEEISANEVEGASEEGTHMFQLFWANDSEFNEEQSESSRFDSGENLRVEFAIEADSACDSLRLDPCTTPGIIYLKKIEVFSENEEKSLFSASEENAFDNIVPSGDLEVEGIELDRLILEAEGDDPQILIVFDSQILKSFRVVVDFGFFRLGA